MRHLTTLLFLLLTSLAYGQTAEISATIVDTTGTTLPGANAILLRTSDTLLTSFGTTDAKGEFLMQKVPAGEYLLRVSFLGFERPDQTITVTASDQYLGLGELTMYPSGFLLSGVEVTADRIPIRMKGDTMLYDAGAFAVGENAKVEDLLRRLPGMSIDANGQLTWRGRPVQEIMINGKPFFAGNATMVTQNLDAEAIKNVEVFDQKSDAEEITGVDDGEENTTVNLEMKEDFKSKLFGQLYAGGGTSERYQAGGRLFRISDATQLGFLGTINNVNRVGFTGEEQMDFNRSSGRGSYYSTGGGGLPFYDGGQTPGQNRSIAAGINFGRTVGENGQLSASYTLFDRQQTQAVIDRQAFTRQDQERETESITTDAMENYSHGLNLRFEQEVDTTTRINVRASGTYGGNDNVSLASTLVKNNVDTLEDYTVEDRNQSNTPFGRLNASYNRRLRGKQGRSVGANVFGNYQRNQTDLQVLTDGLSESAADLAIIGGLVNGLQDQNRRNHDLGYGGEARFTEPLGKQWRIEQEVGYDYTAAEGEFELTIGEQRTFRSLERRFQGPSAATELVYTYGKNNSVQFGGQYLYRELELLGDENRQSSHSYLLPRVSWRTRSDKMFTSMSLYSSVRAPSVAQLQTIARPSFNGVASVGNPDLTPQVDYSLWSNIWFNDQFRAISLGGYVSGEYSDNAFGNSLTFTEGQQIYQTINVSHTWSGRGSLNSTVGMAFIDGELRLSVDGSSSWGQGFVDGVARNNITTNVSGTIDLTTEFNEKSFLKAGYTYNRNANSFDDEESVEIVTITHDIIGQFELEVSPKWRFETRLLYRFFDATAFAPVDPIPDLRAALEVRPFKSGHYFRFAVEDTFNQNTVVTRQAQANVTSERISDGLGRYLLATFHYEL